MAMSSSICIERPPKADQVQLVQSYILHAREKLEAMEADVAASQMALRLAQEHHQSLLDKRIHLRAHLARQQNLLNPALFLPPETLAEIFMHCVEDDPYAAWTVSSICHDWRIAALSAPRLWARITIPYRHTPLSTIMLWLDRCKSVKQLDIDLQATVHGRLPSLADFSEVMHLLASNLSRWSSFRMQTNVDDFINICLERCYGDAPLLKSFYVGASGGTALRRLRRVAPVLEFGLGPTPLLTEVALHDCAWLANTHLLKGLKYLDIVSPPETGCLLSDIRDVLEACPRLKTLNVRTDVQSSPTISKPTPVRLPHLRTLSGNGILIPLLGSIIAPSLEVLIIEGVRGPHLMRALNVLDLTSHPPLHTLRIKHGTLLGGAMYGVSLDSIKELEFCDSEVDDQFFLTLAVPTAVSSTWIRPYRTWSLPSLQVLVLKRCRFLGQDSLKQLVEARNPSSVGSSCAHAAFPARLRAVEVIDCPKIPPNFKIWLHDYISNAPTPVEWRRIRR